MARSLAPKGQLWQDHEQADPFQSSPSRVACPATSCPLRNAVSVLSYTRYVDASFRTARCQKSVVKKVNREMICKRTEDGNRFKAKTKVLRKRPGTKLSPKDAKRSYLPRCNCLKDYQMNTPVVQEVLPRSLTGLAQECGGRCPGEGRREEENGGCKGWKVGSLRARVCGQLLAGSRRNGESTHDKSYLKSPIGARARFVRDPGPARTRSLSWFSMNQPTDLLYPRHRAYTWAQKGKRCNEILRD